jgi:hypothetical protein
MVYSAAVIKALLLVACVSAALFPGTLQGSESFDVSQADNVAMTALLKSSELPGPWWIERPWR